jgi:anti-anti-sigma factor
MMLQGTPESIERNNESAIIHLPRIFGYGTNFDVLQKVKNELERGIIALFLNFSKTERIDSSAIGSLVSAAKECITKGTSLTLCDLNSDIKELFIQTGFDKIFNIKYIEGFHQAESNIFEKINDRRLLIKKEFFNDICIFHLSGIMNNPQGSRYFKKEFLFAMAEHNRILLDFAEVTFFDSLSVSVLLNLNNLIKETGGSMRICGSNEIIGDLFSTLNIRGIIPFFKSKEAALKDWKDCRPDFSGLQ